MTSQLRPFHLALHVGHFFRPLIDQKHHHVGVRKVMQRGFGHSLHQDRLAGPRRADDQPSLAKSDRRDEIDDAGADFVRVVLHDDPLVGMQRRQVVERDSVGRLVRIVNS